MTKKWIKVDDKKLKLQQIEADLDLRREKGNVNNIFNIIQENKKIK